MPFYQVDPTSDDGVVVKVHFYVLLDELNVLKLVGSIFHIVGNRFPRRSLEILAPVVPGEREAHMELNQLVDVAGRDALPGAGARVDFREYAVQR